jgi:hypothetical protein
MRRVVGSIWEAKRGNHRRERDGGPTVGNAAANPTP